MNIIGRAALAAQIAAAPGAPALAADGFEIAKVRVHLFYERSGTLSEDVAGTVEPFFNTVIGEGAALEPASNVLVVVEMTAPAGASTETPLVIDVSAGGDSPAPLVSRSHDFLYTGYGDGETSVARAVWVENATCAPLRVEVTHGADRETVEVPFLCGE